MALSGTINGSTSNAYINSKIVWTATQSISGNYSDVTATLYYSRNNTGYTTEGTWSGSITINGTTTNSSKQIKITYNSNTIAMSATTRVYHNNDGTKTITISATGKAPPSSLESTSCSSNVTLNTIPRASKINSFIGTNLAGSFSVGYTSYSSGFTNKLRISIPNVKALETFNYTSETSFTLSQASLNYLYSYTSNTDKVKLGAVIETWNGSTKIGESQELVNDCYVPNTDAFRPKLGSISLDPVNITTADGTSRNILIQNKNQINVSVSGCSAGTGSGIKSYTFAAIYGSKVIDTKTITSSSTSASTSFGPFLQTGSIKFRVTVTDNRQRSTDNSGKEQTQECLIYEAPSFSSFTVYRCDSNGNANAQGTNLTCSFVAKYSSVDSTNKYTVQTYYKKSTDSNWTAAANVLTNGTDTNVKSIIKSSDGQAITFDEGLTYLVYAIATDNYNGSVRSSSITVFGSSRIFNIRPNGTGMAFGKMAESDNLFESKWPAQFDDDCKVSGKLTVDGGLMLGTSTQSVTPTAGITVHDVRDAEITPDSFGDKNANFYFDMISNRWYGILHMKGWTGDYAAWELAGNAHNSSVDDTLKYRQGRGDTWGDWQTVLTNKNIGSYALSPSGAAMTGQLYLGANLWLQDQTSGLNCQNSDITNVNAIYFQDASDSAGEAINFYRSSGNWDTLYAYNGALKFHPNRATDTALGGYTIFHSNNFRTGTCTLYTNGSGTTVNFSSAMTGTPTIMLTPLTSTAGALPAKVLSRSASGFTAIIGGDAIAAGTAVTFMYLALSS